jgi:hypothetical protein
MKTIMHFFTLYVGTWYLVLTEEHRLSSFENRVLKWIFSSKSEKENNAEEIVQSVAS